MKTGYWSSRNDMHFWAEAMRLESEGGRDTLTKYLSERTKNRSLRILDLGCGDGRLTPYLIEGNKVLVGVDNCSLIEQARRRKIKTQNGQEIIYCQKDMLEGLGFLGERRFDLTLAAHSLHFIEWHRNFGSLMTNVSERTRPGGTFMYVGHTLHQRLLDTLETGFKEQGFQLQGIDIDTIPDTVVLEMKKQ